ncbi:MAG: hypothetical protein J0L73_25235 [Verrucomicrobia bacterium]|nr:hypothetical protein [Verrucomicrobiota bacterium]
MKFFISLFFTACCLSACCDSGAGGVSTAAPYSDFDPISAESYSRAYLRVMSASEVWQRSKDQGVIVCGSMGNRTFKAGVTVDEVVKSIHSTPFQAPFYNVAVWRPKTAALYGVRFGTRRSVEPSIRTLTSAERLLAGDVIIILEKMVCF